MEGFDRALYASRTKLLDIVEEVEALVNISEADIIISGGRGMGEKVNFKILEELAQVLAGHHLTVMVRKSRGRDIRAACGQLIVEGSQPSPAQRLAELM